MCYISMDLFHRGLQTNGKLFFKFWINFLIFGRNQKFFKRIARCEYWSNCNILYISRDFSQRAVQSDGNLLSNFNSFSNYWPKTKKYSNRVNINWSAMYFISMDLTLQALQTNRIFFFKFQNHFLNELNCFKTIVALGLANVVGEAFVLISSRSSWYINGKVFKSITAWKPNNFIFFKKV